MARDSLIAVRRGTAAAWTLANPTLSAGEPGFETDTLKLKIGNGSTAWNSLAYQGGSTPGLAAVLGVSNNASGSVITGVGSPSGGSDAVNLSYLGGAITDAESYADGIVATEASARSTADGLLTPKSRTLTAGDGLSGGGDLSSDRSFAVNVDGSTIETNSDTLRVKDAGITAAKLANTAVTPTAYGDATHVGAFTVDQQGRLTAAASTAITFPAGGLAVYGDGSDGVVTFVGNTVVLGITPSPSSAVNGVYTLARDIFLADGSTLNSGISIITNGFRIFCQGTFTNNGTIQWNGNAGAALLTAGAALSNAGGSINAGTTSTAPGTAGGAGASPTGANGTTYTGVASFGGVGGGGGTGTSGAGGSGGSIVALSAVRTPPRHGWAAIQGAGFAQTAYTPAAGGTGGGGGGGDGTGGGGGGGGGGIVVVAAKVFAGTGVIQARGGAGGTPATGARGGGGGGGGGVVIVVSSSVSAGAVSGQTIDANGGARGLKSGGGTENAANGNNGTVILLPN